ncbi:MAG: hypothetical protein ACOY93_21440 [Bacillota bacterium]
MARYLTRAGLPDEVKRRLARTKVDGTPFALVALFGPAFCVAFSTSQQEMIPIKLPSSIMAGISQIAFAHVFGVKPRSLLPGVARPVPLSIAVPGGVPAAAAIRGRRGEQRNQLGA